MKHGPGSNMDKDSLFAYNMATKAVSVYLIDCSNSTQEMQYSPASNKVVFLGIQTNTSKSGVYSFDLSTQTFKYESPFTNNGTLLNCSTFDEVGNRYFSVHPTNMSGTAFNVMEYNLNTNTLVNHNIGAPGIGFGQFFYNVPAPAGVGNSVSEDDFSLFPNPASGILHVNAVLHGRQAALRILDMSGKVLLEKSAKDGRNELNINTFPAGRYVVSICYENTTYSRLVNKL